MIRVAAACLLMPLAVPPAPEPSERLNVLFVAVDDLRPELGCYGHPKVRSPHIDRLAARGMRFDRAYCQFSVCNPSRASLLTGLRPDRTRVLDNNTFFRKVLPDAVTLPERFRREGYFTARVGKIFHGTADMEDPRAWDSASYPSGTPAGRKGEGRNLTEGRVKWCSWLAAEGDDEDQADGQIAREAVAILEAKRDRPFFLAVGFHKPHDPFVAPRRYFEPYPLEALELPKEPAGRSPDLPHALGGWKAEFDRWGDRERLEFLRAYYACVTFMDAQLGKVLDALDRLGLRERTVVLLFGDHGYHLGDRGWWNKNTVFERSALSPLVVAAPGMKAAGRPCARLVEFVDFYPTLLELCGLAPQPGLDGKSFRPLLDDPDLPWKQEVFTQVWRGKFAGKSVRTEHWRYIEWDDGKRGRELYDHEADSGEWKNLADDPAHAATVAALSEKMRGK